MKKVLLGVVLAFFLGFSLVAAGSGQASVDSELKKLAHYAEEYETGNLNYVGFLVYSSAVQGSLSELLGATDSMHGKTLTQEQLKKVFGEPKYMTKWVWSEWEQSDVKLDGEVGEYKKVVFDGNKIQVQLGAWPHIISKDSNEVVYNLNFWVESKRPDEEFNLDLRIEEIKELAEEYDADPSSSNGDALAKASVDAEKAFQRTQEQSADDCEDLMNKIFGSEHKREPMNMFSNEILFYENDADRAEAKINLNMCDDCEWNWINLNMWVEMRKSGSHFEDSKEGNFDYQKYKQLSNEELKAKTRELVNDMKSELEVGDYSGAMASSQELQMVTQAWNEVANDVWNEIDKLYRLDWESMTPEESEECSRNYCWIANEQKRRIAEKDLRKQNYGDRKAFYLSLFEGYERKESYSVQQEWEMRLFEKFVEKGKETCDNGKDDNENGAIDCADSQCGGKICGRLNSESGEEIDMYCIAGVCQIKEEIIVDVGPVCGNNICEPGEMGEFEAESNENYDTATSAGPSGGEGAGEDFLLASENAGGGEDHMVRLDESGETGEDEENSNGEEGEAVTICHVTPGSPNGAHTIIVGKSAVEAHLAHGDYLGECKDSGSLLCPQDCIQCEAHEPIECNGKVIFSGEDENGCPLEPICLAESDSCDSDEDCKFLCGIGGCFDGKCQLDEMEECKEAECSDGEKKKEKCNGGKEVVKGICVEGLWEETGVECEDEGGSCDSYCMEFLSRAEFDCPGDLEISGDYPDCDCEWVCEDVSDDECVVKSDCGGKNDVCSNGKCVTLPSVVEEEEEKVEQEENKDVDLVPGVPGLSPDKDEESSQPAGLNSGENQKEDNGRQGEEQEEKEEQVEEEPEESGNDERDGELSSRLGRSVRFTPLGYAVS
ncbi:MAG: hypothetical protein KKD18_02190, partial [Nanoarchaeota archaeon]|nr:hypothetical protein [Nanoarchaeota archaeon]